MNRNLIAAGALVLALAGCAATPGAAPSAPPSEQPSLAPSPSATPTPIPVPTQTALDELIVSPLGIDTILISEPVPTEPASTAIVTYDDDKCTYFGKVGEPFVGLWLPNYAESAESTDGLGAFTVRTKGGVKNGAVTMLWVWSPKIKTETGIHRGSSREEVEAAYPNPTHLIHDFVTDIYVIDEGKGRMVIEVVREAGGQLTEADVDTVYMLGVQPSNVKAVSAANVSGTGGCGE